MAALRNTQREGTLCVGCDDLLTGIMHHVAVKLERYSWHRYRGVAIIDVTRIDVVGVHEEIEVLRPVRVGREDHRTLIVRTCIVAAVTRYRHRDYISSSALERQSLELIVAGFVGLCRIEAIGTGNIVGTALHSDTAQSGTVGHADITVNHTRGFAFARTGQALDISTLALPDALHLIVVGLLHQHGLVFEEQLVQVGGNGIGPCSIGIEAVQTAQHTEEVVVATGGLPNQFDAALLLVGCQRGDAVAVLETVVCQVALVNLLHSIDGRVALHIDNRQWRLATAYDEVEGVFHALARNFLRKLILLDDILVA